MGERWLPLPPPPPPPPTVHQEPVVVVICWALAELLKLLGSHGGVKLEDAFAVILWLAKRAMHTHTYCGRRLKLFTLTFLLKFSIRQQHCTKFKLGR